MKIESKDEVEKQSNQEQHAVDTSKRSFSKAGIAAPILLSFSSRAAWSGVVGLENCSFNQALSGNISPGANLDCGPDVASSRSPGFYQGQCPDEWFSRYGVGDEFFKDANEEDTNVEIHKDVSD